ncbi:cysteine hydrolase family protein [Ammoniphilus resinae]|uniref:Nicotinamidase-related amidase n=1 Tax=Ammoniphilus resinae TaxID=861532 RepID=A0ABS4GSS4_9BACL|nr:isochorismatase family cysteine hydrolase [Ammoniphilus resinae]MBP1933177.1 nicotinamidase-related amidase [Ammoniphilus resinae]
MDLKKTALILIDLQKESKYGIEGIEGIVSHAQALIRVCRELDVPIIYTRHINRKDCVGLSNGEPLDDQGAPIFYSSDSEDIEILDGIKPLQEDIVIDKYRWSSFHQTSLDLILRSKDIKHLLIGGLVTDGCLMTSIFDGYFRDYQINLVKDICGATNEGAHMASILIMANWIYDLKIFNTDELIKKLYGKEYRAWESTAPDQLQFTPENMRSVFQRLG